MLKRTSSSPVEVADLIRAARHTTVEDCAQIVDEIAKTCKSHLGCEPFARAKLKEAAAYIRRLKHTP